MNGGILDCMPDLGGDSQFWARTHLAQLRHGPLLSLTGSEVWARALYVVLSWCYSGLMRNFKPGPILGTVGSLWNTSFLGSLLSIRVAFM